MPRRGRKSSAHHRRVLGSEHRRLEEHERMHELRCIESQSDRDRTTAGVTDHVCPRDAELAHQRDGVTRMVSCATRLGHRVAAPVSPSPVPDDAVVVREPGASAQRNEGVREDTAVDQEDRVTFATILILEPGRLGHRRHLAPPGQTRTNPWCILLVDCESTVGAARAPTGPLRSFGAIEHRPRRLHPRLCPVACAVAPCVVAPTGRRLGVRSGRRSRRLHAACASGGSGRLRSR